jgi:hypothetical protein
MRLKISVSLMRCGKKKNNKYFFLFKFSKQKGGVEIKKQLIAFSLAGGSPCLNH